MNHQAKPVVTREAVPRKPHFGGQWFTRAQDRIEPDGGHPVGGGRQVLAVHPAARKKEFDLAAPFRSRRRRREAHFGTHHELLPALGHHRRIRDPGVGRRVRAHRPHPKFDAGRQTGLRPAVLETAPLEVRDQHHLPAPARRSGQQAAGKAECGGIARAAAPRRKTGHRRGEGRPLPGQLGESRRPPVEGDHDRPILPAQPAQFLLRRLPGGRHPVPHRHAQRAVHEHRPVERRSFPTGERSSAQHRLGKRGRQQQQREAAKDQQGNVPKAPALETRRRAGQLEQQK